MPKGRSNKSQKTEKIDLLGRRGNAKRGVSQIIPKIPATNSAFLVAFPTLPDFNYDPFSSNEPISFGPTAKEEMAMEQAQRSARAKNVGFPSKFQAATTVPYTSFSIPGSNQLEMWKRTLQDVELSRMMANSLRYEQGVSDYHQSIAQAQRQAAFTSRQLNLSDWKAPVEPLPIEPPVVKINEGFNAFQGAMSKLEKVPKWKVGVGAGLGVGLGIIGINAIRFSSRDDEYNTIPGLRHGGMAQQMRQANTDFGSGYQGLQQALDKQKSEEYTSALWNIKYMGLALSVPAYLMARKEEPLAVMQKWYGPNIGKVVKYLPAATFVGIEAVRVAYSQASPWEIGAGLAGAAVLGSATEGILRSVGSMLKHKGLSSGMTQLMSFAGYALGEYGYNKFFGKDDAHNTIQGMSELGSISLLRKINTDFGSGYQGQENESSSVTKAMLGGAIGASAGFTGIYFGLRAGEYDRLANYPQLRRLHEIGKQHGVRIVTRADPLSDVKDLKGFKGIVYAFDLPRGYDELPLEDRPANVINLEKTILGGDKLVTYNYFAKRGSGYMHPDTWDLEGFLREQIRGKGPQSFVGRRHVGQGVLQMMREAPGLRETIEAQGGLSGWVLKKKSSALQEGVWVGLENVPENIWKEIESGDWNRYMISRREKLVAEFRAITVAGKSVYEAHRFGSKSLNEMLGLVAKVDPQLTKYLKSKHYHENIIPILNPDLSKRLRAFAEKAHGELPPDIVTAWDIGLTETGQFKIMEMQRRFGTINVPIARARIEEALGAGLSKKLYVKAAIGTGILGLFGAAISSLFAEADSTKENAAINPSPGNLHPQGELSGPNNEAAKHIWAKTSHGSKWDRMKSISKLLGLEFDDVLASKAFHEALAGGKVIKQLGEGAFARAELMITTFGGQELQYVRKTVHPKQAIDNWMKQQIDNGHDMLEVLRTAKQNTSPLLEAQRLKEVEKVIDISPTSYMSTDKQSFMEYMEGPTLETLIKRGEDISTPVQQTQQAIKKLSAGGLINFDPNTNNLIWNPKTQHVSWIDWGYASRLETAGYNQSKMTPGIATHIMERELSSKVQAAKASYMRGQEVTNVVPTSLSGNTQPQPLVPQLPSSSQLTRARALQQSEIQKGAQAQIWSNAQKAGSGHKSAYARRVRQSRNPGDRR